MNIPVPLKVILTVTFIIESDRTHCYTGKFNMTLSQSVWSSRGSLTIFMRVSWCLQLQECGNSCLSTLYKWTGSSFFFEINNLLHGAQWESVGNYEVVT